MSIVSCSDCQAMLRGSYSYHNNNGYAFEMGQGLQGRITCIDNNVARLHFLQLNADTHYAPVPIPNRYVLHDLATRAVVPPYNEEFIIIWSGNYELKDGDNTVLSLDVQREQAIRTRFEGGVIEA
jgi:hypothetical protein